MDVWIPTWEFYLETHERMLEEFGGHPGIEYNGEVVFTAAIQRVIETQGDIDTKAGVMLERLRSDRIVSDAQKRTAYTITTTFLEMNGSQMCITDPETASSFVKDILKYDLSEIIEWIKNGQVPEKS
ncbi:hypothetical protein HQ586_09635 [Candidatus Bathyarchaeota archaeon]|nr:hypothetical protein [Candidatus Bathyarchaeota archaeon]